MDTLWAYWHFHHVSIKVGEYLKQCRIGSLADWDGDETSGIDMYADDPGGRSPDQPLLRPTSQVSLFDRPWNSETDVGALIKQVEEIAQIRSNLRNKIKKVLGITTNTYRATQ